MVMKQLNSLNSFVIVISLISHNFVPFYWIQVGFSLKSIVLITEHFYTLCEIDFQILNFGAKFERHLWRHIVNHKCDATTTECGFPQTMFLPSFASFGILYIPLWTKWNKNTHFWPSCHSTWGKKSYWQLRSNRFPFFPCLPSYIFLI